MEVSINLALERNLHPTETGMKEKKMCSEETNRGSRKMKKLSLSSLSEVGGIII